CSCIEPASARTCSATDVSATTHVLARPARSWTLTIAERRLVLAAADALVAALVVLGSVVLTDLLVGRPALVPRFGPVFFAAVWPLALFLVDGYSPRRGRG